MSSINPDEIKRIADLAHLDITDKQAELFTDEARAILGYVEKLNAIDTDLVDPTNQVTGLVDVWRADEVKPSLSHDSLKQNAPDWSDGYYKVRRVL